MPSIGAAAPQFLVDDLDASLAFYERRLGFSRDFVYQGFYAETVSRSARFETVVLEGHKGLAFELPFDPAKRWEVTEERLWPGRRGWRVKVSMKRARFESFVVPRSKRFWVLVSDDMKRSGRLRAGSRVDFTVAPVPLTPPSPAGRGL